jgi:hypothetical protein
MKLAGLYEEAIKSRVAERDKKKCKKKASVESIDKAIQEYMLAMYQLNGGKYYGMTPAATPDYKLAIESNDDLSYNITITSSTAGKKAKGYVPDSFIRAAKYENDMQKRQMTASISSMLKEFDMEFILNINV